MKKLIRDKVISMTNEGDKVGVYFEGDDKERFIEMSPEQADRVIKAYNDEIKCNWCYWSGNEEDLIIKNDEEYCPNCKEKGYLMDIKE